jgi:hypothetical protein
MMTPKEYAGLLLDINKKFSKLKNMNVHSVHSTYYSKPKKISEILLKIDYTEDGSPLSVQVNKVGVPINAKQKQIKFRLDKCDKIYILLWIDNFIKANKKENKNGN